MDEPDRPPRFPYCAAVICVVSVTAAVWLWMRYSYCWELTPEGLGSIRGRYDLQLQLWTLGPLEEGAWPAGSYVFVRAQPRGTAVAGYLLLTGNGTWGWDIDAPEALSDLEAWRMLSLRNREKILVGRLIAAPMEPTSDWPWGPTHVWDAGTPAVDTSASRFTSESVVGLAIGVAGAFLFALKLGQWVKDRRLARRSAKHRGRASPTV